MRAAITVTIGMILTSLGAVCAPAQAVPVAERELDWVLKRTPDLTKGAKLYDTCLACHGKEGQGVADGTVPAIGGQHFTVLAKQLVDFRSGWRPDPRMKHFSNVRFLAYSQDIADVAAYISNLPLPQVKLAPSAEVSGRGAMLFARSCARCHGEQGEGNADTLAPRLASQHSAYIVRQLEDTQAGWRKPMDEAHTKILAGMSSADVVTVAAYVAALATVPN